eukprot:10525-Heterococcus_DN1.PRE.2
MRFRSRSSAMPCTVVIHFLPDRCCTRTCTLPCPERSSSLDSANGSVMNKPSSNTCKYRISTVLQMVNVIFCCTKAQ